MPVFQNTIKETLSGLLGISNLNNDILIFSNILEEHHIRLRDTLRHLSDSGLTLNKYKCSFFQDIIEFFGYIFSLESLQGDPKKVALAIKTASVPRNPTDISSFLWMATY